MPTIHSATSTRPATRTRAAAGLLALLLCGCPDDTQPDPVTDAPPPPPPAQKSGSSGGDPSAGDSQAPEAKAWSDAVDVAGDWHTQLARVLKDEDQRGTLLDPLDQADNLETTVLLWRSLPVHSDRGGAHLAPFEKEIDAHLAQSQIPEEARLDGTAKTALGALADPGFLYGQALLRTGDEEWLSLQAVFKRGAPTADQSQLSETLRQAVAHARAGEWREACVEFREAGLALARLASLDGAAQAALEGVEAALADDDAQALREALTTWGAAVGIPPKQD
jgi:hypothetical protein